MDAKQSDLEIQKLVLKSIAGDSESFEALVKLYSRRILYYVYQILTDYDLSEDVLQNVWLTVYQQLPRLKSTRAFSVWLYRIARNQAYLELRKARRYVSTVNSLEEMAIDVSVDDDDALQAESIPRMHECLEKMRPEFSEVLTLKYMEGLSYDEISSVLGCSLGIVKIRLYRARKMLAEMMEELRHD